MGDINGTKKYSEKYDYIFKKKSNQNQNVN